MPDLSRVQSRIFKEGHFHLISDEDKYCLIFPIRVMLKMAHSSFKKGLFDIKGGQ